MTDPVITTKDFHWFEGNPTRRGAYRVRNRTGSPNYCWRYWDGEKWHNSNSTRAWAIEAFNKGIFRNVKHKELLWARKVKEDAEESVVPPPVHPLSTDADKRLVALLVGLRCFKPGEDPNISAAMLASMPADWLLNLGDVIATQAAKAPDGGVHPDENAGATDFMAKYADKVIRSDALKAAFHAGALHQRVWGDLHRKAIGIKDFELIERLDDARTYMASEVRAVIARAVTQDRDSGLREQRVEWETGGRNGVTHTISLGVEEAAKELKAFYDRWPNGLDEIEAALHGRAGRMLSQEEIDTVFNTMPGGKTRYMLEWGYTTFAHELLAYALRKGDKPARNSEDDAA